MFIRGDACLRWVQEHPDDQEHELCIEETETGAQLCVRDVSPEERTAALRGVLHSTDLAHMEQLSATECRALAERAFREIDNADPNISEAAKSAMAHIRLAQRMQQLVVNYPSMDNEAFHQGIKELVGLHGPENVNRTIANLTPLLEYCNDPHVLYRLLFLAITTYTDEQQVAIVAKMIELDQTSDIAIDSRYSPLFLLKDVAQSLTILEILPNEALIRPDIISFADRLIQEGNEAQLREMMALYSSSERLQLNELLWILELAIHVEPSEDRAAIVDGAIQFSRNTAGNYADAIFPAVLDHMAMLLPADVVTLVEGSHLTFELPPFDERCIDYLEGLHPAEWRLFLEAAQAFHVAESEEPRGKQFGDFLQALSTYPPEKSKQFVEEVLPALSEELVADPEIRMNILEGLAKVPLDQQKETALLLQALLMADRNLEATKLVPALAKVPQERRAEVVASLQGQLPLPCLGDLCFYLSLEEVLAIMEHLEPHDERDAVEVMHIGFEVNPHLKDIVRQRVMRVISVPERSAIVIVRDNYTDIRRLFPDDDDPIVQRMHEVHFSDDLGIKSPYFIFDRLRDWHANPTLHTYHYEDVEGMHVALCLEELGPAFTRRTAASVTEAALSAWMEEPPPVTEETLRAQVTEMKSRLAAIDSDDARQQLEALAWYEANTLPRLLQILEASADSDATVSPITLQLATVLKNLHLWDDVDEGGPNLLTHRQRRLFQLLEATRDCETGQKDNINALYSPLLLNEAAVTLGAPQEGELTAEATDFLWKCYDGWVNTQLSTESPFMRRATGVVEGPIAQMSHQAAYVKNVLSHRVGFAEWPDLFFDRYTGCLYDPLVARDLAELLIIFQEEATIDGLAEHIQREVAKNMPEMYSKINHLFGGIAAMGGEELLRMWYFDDETEESGLTKYGAIRCLQALQILTFDEDSDSLT